MIGKDKNAHLDRLNQHFITSYQQAHPKDRIISHDLTKDDTPILNSQMLMALRKKQHQKPLSSFEQKLLCEHDDWLSDFMLADKYLFVAPTRNFVHCDQNAFAILVSCFWQCFNERSQLVQQFAKPSICNVVEWRVMPYR